MRKKEVFKKPAIFMFFSAIFPMLFTLVIIAMIIFGLNQTEQSSKSEGLRILEDGIRRAVITCYAVEGYYPESISYIEEHYGISIDRTRYVVHYVAVGSNLMPAISVFEYN